MEEITQEIKKPGRPKQMQAISNDTPKKGKRSWKPASLNEFFGKEDGYRYRMARKDPDNLAKKEAEGWESVSAINNSAVKHNEPGRIDDGAKLTSVVQGKDWILQRIPEELAQERDAYYQSENNRRVSGLTAHARKEVAKVGADTHGEITISSRNGTQVLK